MQNNNNLPQTAAFMPPIGSIDAYIYWVNKIPMLSAAEELELATKLQQNGDLSAAKKLVLANLRYVVSIANGYHGYGLAKADLIQEGAIGLMKAVKRFDPTMKVRLMTFAVHWIKAEIHEFVLRNWRIVKIATTKAQRKLFFNLRRATKQLTWFNNEEIANIAKELKVEPAEVRTMEARMSQTDMAFDNTEDDSTDNEASFSNPANYLQADILNPLDEVIGIDQNQTEKLNTALDTLDSRSRNIIQRRFLQENKATLHELAAEYKISAERVRQIEDNAMKKLKTMLVE